METLGSLCDKLTIIKLKQFHSEDSSKIASLEEQERQLVEEIDGYIACAVNSVIPVEKLRFQSNKVYKKQGNEIREIEGNTGEVFAELSKVNCELWHEQEKVYDFEKIPAAEKDRVVKKLAVLNLERNQCIDTINENLYLLCKK